MNLFIIVMGVSGCGKTTIGKSVAKLLDVSFYEGDDYHSKENVHKMTEGTPLTDEDRQDWLNALAALIEEEMANGNPGVLTCSALKEKYRKQLNIDPDRVIFIYLKGSYGLIHDRMQSRDNHYMGPEMLKSQFNTLEEPDDIFAVGIDQPPEAIVNQVMAYLEKRLNRHLHE